MPNEQKSIEDLFHKGKNNDIDEQSLNEKIAKLRLQEKEELVKKSAERRGFGYINLSDFAFGAEALKLIPFED